MTFIQQIQDLTSQEVVFTDADTMSNPLYLSASIAEDQNELPEVIAGLRIDTQRMFENRQKNVCFTEKFRRGIKTHFLRAHQARHQLEHQHQLCRQGWKQQCKRFSFINFNNFYQRINTSMSKPVTSARRTVSALRLIWSRRECRIR